VFPVRYGQTYRVELSFKYKTGRRIMSRIAIVILIYHRHKPIDLILVFSLVAAGWPALLNFLHSSQLCVFVHTPGIPKDFAQKFCDYRLMTVLFLNQV
jgi:hypothetical protein